MGIAGVDSFVGRVYRVADITVALEEISLAVGPDDHCVNAVGESFGQAFPVAFDRLGVVRLDSFRAKHNVVAHVLIAFEEVGFAVGPYHGGPLLHSRSDAQRSQRD